MNRKELYAKVKELHLEEEIKKEFGDNYTRVSSVNLSILIKKHEEKAKVSQKAKEAPKPKAEPEKEENVVTNQTTASKPETKLEGSKFDRLVQILVKKHLLLPSEIDAIYGK